MAKIARSLFWAEPVAFSALVERALRPAATSTIRSARPDLAPQQLQRTATAVSEQHPFSVPESPIEGRLEALLHWLRQETGCRQAFVTDADGLALVRYQVSDELIAAAASTSMRLLTVHQDLALPQPQCQIISLVTEELLHQIMTETPWGLMTLGFTTVESISAQSLQSIRQAFQDSLVEKEQSSHET